MSSGPGNSPNGVCAILSSQFSNARRMHGRRLHRLEWFQQNHLGWSDVMLKTLYTIIICHLIGDYPLQTDFIAQTKGKNWYHLLIHCFLYSAPFAFVFGVDWRLIPLIGTHLIIDSLKARWKKIGYVTDQCLHYAVVIGLYLLPFAA